MTPDICIFCQHPKEPGRERCLFCWSYADGSRRPYATRRMVRQNEQLQDKLKSLKKQEARSKYSLYIKDQEIVALRKYIEGLDDNE